MQTDRTPPSLPPLRSRAVEWLANVLFDIAYATERLARRMEDRALNGRRVTEPIPDEAAVFSEAA